MRRRFSVADGNRTRALIGRPQDRLHSIYFLSLHPVHNARCLGYMPQAIRIACTLLKRKRNYTVKSLVKRLQDENKRFELMEPILAAAVELATDGTLFGGIFYLSF